MKDTIAYLYFSKIYKPLLSHLRIRYSKFSEEDIANAMGQTLYEFWKDLEKRPNSPMTATLFHYIRTIAENQCFHLAQRFKKKKNIEEPEGIDPEFLDMLENIKSSSAETDLRDEREDSVFYDILATFPNLSKKGFETAEELLNHLLSELNEKDQKYLRDRYFLIPNKLTHHYRDLASSWSEEEKKPVSEGQARKRVFDAIRKLRKNLNNQ